MQFSPEALSGLIATILAWFFARFPSVRVWFAKKGEDEKSLWMIGIIVGLMTIFVITGLTGLIPWVTMAGIPILWHPIPWTDIILTLIIIIAGNQGIYPLLKAKEPADVKAAKAARIIPGTFKPVTQAGIDPNLTKS